MNRSIATRVASVMGTLLVVGACGSDDPVIMPNVSEDRLDLALSDIERAGMNPDDVEVVGGGAFGVVDESNWSVCEQEPVAGEEVEGMPRLVVDRSCEAEEPEASPEPAPAASPEPTATAEAAEEVVEAFTVPHLVGLNLQDAQDTLQALGSFVLRQDDATGMERFQVLDSNWKVCGQQPAPGADILADETVVLSAVKLDESCP